MDRSFNNYVPYLSKPFVAVLAVRLRNTFIPGPAAFKASIKRLRSSKVYPSIDWTISTISPAVVILVRYRQLKRHMTDRDGSSTHRKVSRESLE
jgi:hypothetical protein